MYFMGSLHKAVRTVPSSPRVRDLIRAFHGARLKTFQQVWQYMERMTAHFACPPLENFQTFIRNHGIILPSGSHQSWLMGVAYGQDEWLICRNVHGINMGHAELSVHVYHPRIVVRLVENDAKLFADLVVNSDPSEPSFEFSIISSHLANYRLYDGKSYYHRGLEVRNYPFAGWQLYDNLSDHVINTVVKLSFAYLYYFWQLHTAYASCRCLPTHIFSRQLGRRAYPSMQQQQLEQKTAYAKSLGESHNYLTTYHPDRVAKPPRFPLPTLAEVYPPEVMEVYDLLVGKTS